MKKTLFLLFAMALFASCTQINKKKSPEKLYEYKEVKKENRAPIFQNQLLSMPQMIPLHTLMHTQGLLYR